MPASRGGRLRRKGCSLARRTKRQATAAWRLLYRLLFMVSRRFRVDEYLEMNTVAVAIVFDAAFEGASLKEPITVISARLFSSATAPKSEWVQ